MTLIGPTLQRFFTDRLAKQKAVSRHTVASYRDGWHLFLDYLQQQLHIAPAALDFNDVTADVITKDGESYTTQFTYNLGADALSGRFPAGEEASN